MGSLFNDIATGESKEKDQDFTNRESWLIIENMKRRSFIKVVGAAAGGYAIDFSGLHGRDAGQVDHPSGLPRRVLGRTGEMISIVGFPGLALSHCDQDQSNAGIRDAFEKGVNYFDVAPAYGKDGECEIKMGIGLRQLDRSQIFLASKTKMRDREGAQKELERSLKRLETDHFDLYQLHHLWNPADVVEALGPGGALEAVLKAKEEGKIRHIGFSAHTTKAALDAMRGFRFDTVMFPINFVEYFKIGFGREVIELANRQGAALLSIKTLSHGRWPEGAYRKREWWYRSAEEKQEVELAVRFALSLEGVVAGIPPSFLDLLDKAITAGKSFRPIADDEAAQLQALSASCLSLFEREEDRIAGGVPFEPIYPESPYEDCPPCSRV